eukprot:snap_masked-scaffold_12-processed-gene-1.21-mRNA-1 protein AED:1.00 eAED:1.00 QI:0/0/0/0/1/1/2/0/67
MRCHFSTKHFNLVLSRYKRLAPLLSHGFGTENAMMNKDHSTKIPYRYISLEWESRSEIFDEKYLGNV